MLTAQESNSNRLQRLVNARRKAPTWLLLHQSDRRINRIMADIERPLDSGNADYTDDYDIPPSRRLSDSDNRDRLRTYVERYLKALDAEVVA